MRIRVAIVFGVWTLLNVYVGAHLAAGAVGVGRVLAWAGALALAGLPIATLVLGRRGPLRPALGWIGFAVLGLSTLLVVGFAVVDLVRLPVGPYAMLGIAAALTVIGVLGARRPHVVRVSVPIADLPPDLEGFRIVQLSDLHIGPTLKRRWVERVGLSVLQNSHQMVRRGNGRLLFAGVPDLSVPSDPAAALRGAPASDVRVLLAHQPRSAFAARDAGFDLQLSGHTHGGQYFPFNLLVRLFQPFVAGLHRLEAMWLYVSRGTGYWGPPLRLGAPAEITLIQLVRA